MERLALILPCFNEDEIIEVTTEKLLALMKDLIERKKISGDSYILFVNDGSKDNTWKLIEKNYLNSNYINGIKLSRNVGHQKALWAGLMTAKENADIMITMDADLQDDINVVEEMIDKYYDGNQIVYGVKRKRLADSWAKRISAESFYKFMNLLGVKTIYNHADFRLMSKTAVQALSQYKERNLFLRGIVPLLGFKTECVYEELREREAGKSKYSLKKMLNLAIDGITSFSIKPLSLIGWLGGIIVFFSIIMIIQAIAAHFMGDTVAGWTSIVISIWFIGGVQLISLGIVGEYIGRLYIETKERPLYFIEQILMH